jgi:hypothetical protein
VLTDTGGDVEFVGWCSDVERILRFFCCLDHLSDGKDEPFVRWWLGSSLVPTPDVAPLAAIVDGIVPSIIPRRSSLSSTPIMYCLFTWGSVSSTVLARLPFSCHRSNLPFHILAIFFRLRVSVTSVKLPVSLHVTRHSVSCSWTWHASGDRQE